MHIREQTRIFSTKWRPANWFYAHLSDLQRSSIYHYKTKVKYNEKKSGISHKQRNKRKGMAEFMRSAQYAYTGTLNNKPLAPTIINEIVYNYYSDTYSQALKFDPFGLNWCPYIRTLTTSPQSDISLFQLRHITDNFALTLALITLHAVYLNKLHLICSQKTSHRP